MIYTREIISFDYLNVVNMIWFKNDLLYGELMSGVNEVEVKFNKEEIKFKEFDKYQEIVVLYCFYRWIKFKRKKIIIMMFKLGS